MDSRRWRIAEKPWLAFQRVCFSALLLWLSVACVAAAPTIGRQPTNQVVELGKPVSFSITATGLPPLTFQWQLDGDDLLTGTNADLIISSAKFSDAGVYRALVTDARGDSTTSSQAVLTVYAPVGITQQPQPRNVPFGGGAHFSVTATGSPPLRFQWFHDTTFLQGATNPVLTISNATATHAGPYRVRVWNPWSSTESEPALLRVGEPPRIIKPPADQTVAPGNSATFFVEATGEAPLSYQWFFGSMPIPNTKDATFTISSAQPENQGEYRVSIANDFGTVFSPPARLDLTLNTLPFSDDFAEMFVIRDSPRVSGRGANFNATQEAGEPMHDGRRAVRSVWLAWTAPASGVVKLNTFGSDFDTVLAVYVGDSFTQLAPIASNDDSEFNHASELVFNAVAGATYRIAVAGALSSAGLISFDLQLTPTQQRVPVFLAQPRGFSLLPGADALLQFQFESEDPVRIEWFFKGAPIANADMADYPVRNVDELLVGRYRARISTSTHTNISRLADIQINTRGLSNVLAQDKFAHAVDAGFFLGTAPPGVSPSPVQSGKKGNAAAKSGGSGSHGYSMTQIFSTLGSGADPGEPVHCGIGGGHSEWFAYQAETNGTLRIDTEGSNFDTVLAVYIGPGDSYATLTNVACDNNSGSNGLTSKVVFEATQGTIYWVAVDGVGNARGTVKLNIHLGSPVEIVTQPQGATVPTGTNVTFSVVAGGMTNYTYQWRFNGSNISGATSSNFTRTGVVASQAGNYSVVVRNPINAVTSSVATLTVYSGTILISQQPASQQLVAGANGSFTVTASGSGPLTFQWRRNGTNLLARTNSVLSLTNVQLADAGNYSVNVSDANGSLGSSNGLLTVLVPPAITLQPIGSTVASNATGILNAGASGTPAPALQWFFNGAPLAGETAGTLNVPGFQSTHEGVYFLRASNSAGTAQSLGAELLLNAPLRFTNHVITNGQFSARLVGVAGTSYRLQWSTNLLNWHDLATNAPAAGIWPFIDAATNAAMRVYRAFTAD